MRNLVADAGARSVRDAHRLPRRARRRCARDRNSPPRSAAASITTPASSSSCTIRAHQRPAGRRRPLRRAVDAARRARADPGGRLCRLDRGALGLRRRRHERAADPRRALEGPVAGERGKLFRPLRARARQAARRRATIAAPSPGSTASKSPTSRRPKSPRSSRSAPCISASPARTWCAR